MNDEFESQATIILSYTHSDGDSYQFTFEEPMTWPEALDKMVKFIGQIYGYNISDKVAIKRSKIALNQDRWPGPFFGKEDEFKGNPGLTD